MTKTAELMVQGIKTVISQDDQKKQLEDWSPVLIDPYSMYWPREKNPFYMDGKLPTEN